jgi:hypothetical protein
MHETPGRESDPAVSFSSISFFAIHFTHSLHPSKPMLQPSPQIRTGLVGLLFLLTAALPAFGQISLAPNTLFIRETTGVGELFVTNETDQPQEINIRFVFGYPVSDSVGTIDMTYDNPLRKSESGLDDFMRVFPRRFVLGPNQSQTVRIQVLPMQARPAGMFWTRAIVSSNAVTEDVGASGNQEAIATRINYILEQSIPIFYRKGTNSTGVEVANVTTSPENGRLKILAELDRTGNSPYMGTMYATLYDKDNNALGETFRPAYLYYKEWRNMDMDISSVPPGTYRLELRFETQRRDMAPTDLVQAPTQTHSVTITL